MDQMGIPELVQMLESSNGTVRDMAHQMLLWKNAKEAVSALRVMVKDGKLPTARLHALSVLDGLGELDQETLSVASAWTSIPMWCERLFAGEGKPRWTCISGTPRLPWKLQV